MNMRETIRVAWEAMLKNKVRSLLTMLGIIIGVAAVIIMIAISAGTEATISDQITSLGSNLIFISTNFSRGGAQSMRNMSNASLKYTDAQAIDASIDTVKGVVVEQNTSQTVKYGNVSLDDTSIEGTTVDFPTVRDLTVANGRFFTEEEVTSKAKVVVLGATLAQELFGSENPVGQTIRVGTTRASVIGVMAAKGTVGDVDYDTRVYAPLTTVLQKFTSDMFSRIMGDDVRMIYVEVDDKKNLDTTISQIKSLLATRHSESLDELSFSVTTQQDIISTQESTTSAFRSLLGWVAGVSLIVGGIGIMNIMLVSVTERTREIGIRQSVGARPADIRRQFLTEALMLSLVGGIIGTLVGVGGSYIFGKVSDMRTVVQFSSIALAFGSAALIGAFFGFYPANQAAKLDPIEALRHE
jgi:putative ABC transport system permease protein